MILTPEEKASSYQIDRDRNIREGFKSAGKAALNVGSSAVGFGVASKVIPFLNEYIPAELALKGISKVFPKLGEFLKKGMASGLALKDGLDLIKDKIEPKKDEQTEQPEEAQEERNIVQLESPELHIALSELVKGGDTPLKAAEKIARSGKFRYSIKNLQDQHKLGWGKIVENLYGAIKSSKESEKIKDPLDYVNELEEYYKKEMSQRSQQQNQPTQHSPNSLSGQQQAPQQPQQNTSGNDRLKQTQQYHPNSAQGKILARQQQATQQAAQQPQQNMSGNDRLMQAIQALRQARGA